MIKINKARDINSAGTCNKTNAGAGGKLLLTQKEANEAFGVSSKAFFQWRAEGCPCYLIGKVQTVNAKGARYRYNPDKVQAWLDMREEMQNR